LNAKIKTNFRKMTKY